MQASSIPSLIPIPFASSGAKNTIPVASQISVTPGAASYTDGFPPLTRTPLIAGGVAPAGQDFNGILNAITTAILWGQAGGGYYYDSTFGPAIAGYPLGAKLNASDNSGQWINQIDANTTAPESTTTTPTGWVPGYQYGVTAIAGLAATSVTLTPLQAAKRRITLAGTLTANINIIFPAWTKDWIVVNSCTGAFTVTCKTASGNGVTIASGKTAQIVCDGTNITTDAMQNVLQVSNNLSDVASAVTALTNLGGLAINNNFSEIAAKGTATVATALANLNGLNKNNNLSDLTSIPTALANLGLGTAAKRAVGTGANQLPDMSSFTYSTDGSGSFVILLPGGIVIQGANFTTDSNGYKLVTMGVALSDYQALVCEGQSGGWLSSGGIYSFFTNYGCNKISSTQFSVRSSSWRSSDKNFIAQSTVGTWLAAGRI